MRYLDPESLRAKRIPQNYDARQPDARPRRGRGDRVERGHRGDLTEGGYRGEGDRAERGQRGERDRAGGSDVDGKWTRGAVSKDSLDRDLERYRPKALEPEPLDDGRTHIRVLRMQSQAIVD